MRELSGNNVMTTGIWYENLMRLVGTASSVSANAQIVVPHRRGWDGNRYPMTIPDQLDVIYSLAGGGSVNMTVQRFPDHLHHRQRYGYLVQKVP
ncbi:MAG: hypothetical protein Ct9H300mP19_05190 [Dehalococcoidia bacterium]|nr:MAG: hypothetical protein Ct9H300mP19_05190 [Dehalococcoidia bacterium]